MRKVSGTSESPPGHVSRGVHGNVQLASAMLEFAYVLNSSDTLDAFSKKVSAALVGLFGYQSAWIALRAAPHTTSLIAAGACDGAPANGHSAQVKQLAGKGKAFCMSSAKACLKSGVETLGPVSCHGCPYQETAGPERHVTLRLHHAGQDAGALVLALPKESEQQRGHLLAPAFLSRLAACIAAAALNLLRDAQHGLQDMILNEISDQVVLTDLDGAILYMNRTCYRNLQQDEDSLLGRHVRAFGEDPDAGATQEEIVSRTRSEGEWQGEVVNFAKDGTRIVMECKTRLVRDEQGEPRYIAGTARDVTSRLEAEKAVRESEARLRNITSTTRDAIIQLDGRGRVTFWNEAAEHILGYTQEEVIGADIHRLLTPPEYHEAQGRAFRAFQETGRGALLNRTVELEALHRDGTRVAIELSLAASQIDGEWQSTAVLRDIRERKEQQAELQAQRNLLQQLSDRVPGFIYQYQMWPGGHAVFPYASAGVESIYEVAPEEIRLDASPVFGRIHPDDLDHVKSVIEESFAELKPWHDQYRVCLPKRGVRWLEGNAMPERQTDGSVLWHGHIYDITERVEREARVHELSERLQLATQSANLGIWDLDLINNRLIWDAHMCALYGLQPGDFDGTIETWREALHPDDRARALRDVEAALKEDRPFDAEFRVLHPDGSIRHLKGYAVVQREPSANGAPGRALRMTGINIDITERVELEEQLRQSQKMEAIGELAGGIAHDFNNLLQAIHGYTDLAIDALHPEHPAHGHLKEAREGARRSSALVGQLLSFSRRQMMRLETIDLNDAVRGIMHLITRVIGERIQVEFQVSQKPAMVQADAGMVDQVLLNLCVNARDAMPDGGVLSIAVEEDVVVPHKNEQTPFVKPGRHWVLTVRDTGCGMAAGILERVFEPFFTTKEQGKGTGLGLATVYGIVRQHQGFVRCDSQPGLGTIFRVYLPASDATPAAPSTSRECLLEGGSETILVAEDQPMVRNLARVLLTRAGYTVLLAENGREAVELFEAHEGTVDCLLFDMGMPEMNGRDAHACIAGRRPGIPAILTSGYSEDAQDATGLLEDGLWFIKKPFGARELLHAVRQAIDNPPATA